MSGRELGPRSAEISRREFLRGSVSAGLIAMGAVALKREGKGVISLIGEYNQKKDHPDGGISGDPRQEMSPDTSLSEEERRQAIVRRLASSGTRLFGSTCLLVFGISNYKRIITDSK